MNSTSLTPPATSQSNPMSFFNIDTLKNNISNPEFSTLVDCLPRIESWLNDPSISIPDKAEIEALISAKNFVELRDRFYRELEFGTGGLRGVVGAGNNRVNAPVIRRATQGLANYIKKSGPDALKRGVALAYDSRNSSPSLAQAAAAVLAGNGIHVHLFPTLQTTPALSFAVRHLNCISGICLTASHNPQQYNGYKVYWEDGAQIIPPQDAGILSEVFNVKTFREASQATYEQGLSEGRIHFISEEVLLAYFQSLKALQLFPKAPRDLKIVYTPLHGTGAIPARRALTEWGYKQLTIVPEQEKPDGNFPTVKKPNPEEPSALQLAIALAEKLRADVALATDPDSDRLALVVHDPKAAKGSFAHQAYGNYVLLNGNQTGALLIDFLLTAHKSQGTLRPQHKIVKTIVTSELHARICNTFNVEIFDTLTGFKWIAGLVRSWEQQNNGYEFLFGTEESFGFMPGPYVRDKDGIGALCQAVEMVSVLKSQGQSPCDALLKLFADHGAWQEDLVNIDLEGEAGATRIKRIMETMRTQPRGSFGGVHVERILDYKTAQIKTSDRSGGFRLSAEKITLPASDVLQFELTDGTRISMRPSGTEPKLKFYVSVCTQGSDVTAAYATTLERIQGLRHELEAFVESV